MTDSMNKELIKRVQSSLSKYINKPQLTEKLLNKPPFKFLHDIVTNVIQNTGYLTDVFTDEEIISTNVTTKETKIKFLEKLITAIQSTTNKTISARPSKIVAGLEVSKTLELLIAVVFGIETKNKEIKEQISTNTKTKKPETTKINNQNKTKLLEKTKSLEKKAKENIDHDFQKKIQKSDSVELSVVKNDEPISIEMDTTTKSDGEFIGKPIDEEIKNTVDSSVKTEDLNENKLQSEVKSKPEKKDSELIEKTNPDDNPLRKLSETHNISKPLRPKSSRPPAPNRRPQSNTFTEIPKHSDSFFSKNDDKINDIDDNIVTIEVLNDNKSTYDSYTQEDGQGHLVSQILQTQMEFNIKKKTDSSKIEWEGKSVKDQEMLTKEMDTIRQFIQGITKSANPLSKLINNMQENIDQMNRELNYWKNFTEKTNEKLDLQQRVVEEKIKPMVMLLEKLTVDVKDELEMIDYCKANIMKNKSHINYLVSERSKTCTYTSCTTIVEPHFKNINITVDNVWRTVTSTLYCGDNDCSRELHVTLGENVSWQNGRELSKEHSVSNALVEGFTTGSATTFRGDIGFTYKFLSASVGSDIQFQKSTTRETSIETTSTTGSTVSYSLTRDNSIQREEVVTCTAKAGQGIKLLAKTNAIHFTAHFCRPSETGFSQTTPLEYSDRCNPLDAVTDDFIYSDCNYLDFTMLPFNSNAISADIKCLTIRIQK